MYNSYLIIFMSNLFFFFFTFLILELLNPNTCKVIRRKRNKEGGAGGDRVMVLGAMLIEVQTVLQT